MAEISSSFDENVEGINTPAQTQNAMTSISNAAEGSDVPDHDAGVKNTTTQTQNAMALTGSSVVAFGNVTPQPGAIVNDMQALIASMQASISPHMAGVASSNGANAAINPTFPWLSDMQSKLASLKEMTKKLVSSGTLGEFIFFSKLPVELQALIWKFSLPPRILEFCPAYYPYPQQLRHNNPLPIALHVCQQSRTIARAKYCNPVRSIYLHDVDTKTEKPVYIPSFDPFSDMVFIPWSPSRDYLTLPPLLNTRYNQPLSSHGPVLIGLKHIAIDWRVWDKWVHLEALDFTHFKALETLTIVIHAAHGQTHYAVGCKVMWSPTYAGEIQLLESDPESSFVVDLLMETECEMLRQEKAEETPVGWKAPKIEIKYMAMNGKRCCEKPT